MTITLPEDVQRHLDALAPEIAEPGEVPLGWGWTRAVAELLHKLCTDGYGERLPGAPTGSAARAFAAAVRPPQTDPDDEKWADYGQRMRLVCERALESLRSPSDRSLADAEVMLSDALSGVDPSPGDAGLRERVESPAVPGLDVVRKQTDLHGRISAWGEALYRARHASAPGPEHVALETAWVRVVKASDVLASAGGLSPDPATPAVEPSPTVSTVPDAPGLWLRVVGGCYGTVEEYAEDVYERPDGYYYRSHEQNGASHEHPVNESCWLGRLVPEGRCSLADPGDNLTLDSLVGRCTPGDAGPDIAKVDAGLAGVERDRESAAKGLARVRVELAERTRERDAARTRAEEWRDATGHPDRLPWEGKS